MRSLLPSSPGQHVLGRAGRLHVERHPRAGRPRPRGAPHRRAALAGHRARRYRPPRQDVQRLPTAGDGPLLVLRPRPPGVLPAPQLLRAGHQPHGHVLGHVRLQLPGLPDLPRAFGPPPLRPRARHPSAGLRHAAHPHVRLKRARRTGCGQHPSPAVHRPAQLHPPGAFRAGEGAPHRLLPLLDAGAGGATAGPDHHRLPQLSRLGRKGVPPTRRRRSP